MALIKSFSVMFVVEILFIPLSSIASLSVCTVGLLNTFTYCCDRISAISLFLCVRFPVGLSNGPIFDLILDNFFRI